MTETAIAAVAAGLLGAKVHPLIGIMLSAMVMFLMLTDTANIIL